MPARRWRKTARARPACRVRADRHWLARRCRVEHVETDLQRYLLARGNLSHQRGARVAHGRGRKVGRGYRSTEEIENGGRVGGERLDVKSDVAGIDRKANRAAARGDRVFERNRGRVTLSADRRADNRLRDERRQTVLLHRLAIETGTNDERNADERRAAIGLTDDRGAARDLDARHRDTRRGELPRCGAIAIASTAATQRSCLTATIPLAVGRAEDRRRRVCRDSGARRRQRIADRAPGRFARTIR